MIEIYVNGECKSIDAGLSPLGLIESLGISSKAVIVEYNGAVVKTDDLVGRRLSSGDSLELIQIVGGG